MYTKCTNLSTKRRQNDVIYIARSTLGILGEFQRDRYQPNTESGNYNLKN